jgi:glycosyltransferase involved in cell wall biosynthesis
MRIVEFTNNLEIGGAERLAVDLAKALKSRGHELSFVCLRHGGALESVVQAAGMSVLALGKKPGPRVSTLVTLKNYLRQKRIDVVHTHNPLVHHYGTLGGRWAGVPAIVNTIHGIDNLGEKAGFNELLYSTMSYLSSRIVAVCPMAYRAFSSRWFLPNGRLVAINNGIPLEPFLNVERRAAGDDVVFGIVGRLVPVKNHDLLLEAFRLVLEQRPGSTLRILGDGPLRGHLEGRVRELGIAESVRFFGYSAEVPGFLREVDVAVLCSHSEGLPLGILEAMAAALPIVGTDVGGMRDLIEGGCCGWISTPGNRQALAHALLSAAATAPQTLMNMGMSGRAHVVEHYSLQRMAEEYEQLFADLVAA